MTELVHIPFHGTDLLAIEVNGKPFIVLRPAIDALGLDYSTQLAKLRSRSWACVGQCPIQVPGSQQTRSYTTVDVRTFLMLLATVNERLVAEHIKPLLVAFQSEVADVIEAHFAGRATAPQVNPYSGCALGQRGSDPPQEMHKSFMWISPNCRSRAAGRAFIAAAPELAP